MKPQEDKSANDPSKLQYISAEAVKYFEAMQAARDEGGNLEDYIDQAGMDALRRITGFADTGSSLPQNYRTVPTVLESDGRGGVRGLDLFTFMLKNRVVLIEGPVDDVMASIACASLRFLNSDASGDKEGAIKMRINSPGGSVLAGLAIYDAMRSCTAEITTIGIGMQASMGSILMAAGDKRVMTRSAYLMVHQIASGASGKHSETAISESLTSRLHEQLKDIYVRHTGLTHEFWDYVLEHDTWLTADQAKKIGFINDIIEDKKPTAYDKDSIREQFRRAKTIQVPKTAEKILEVLNHVSANGADSAKIRPELVTALAQFPRFWTESKKKEMKALEIANDNKDVADTKHKPAAGGPSGP